MTLVSFSVALAARLEAFSAARRSRSACLRANLSSRVFSRSARFAALAAGRSVFFGSGLTDFCCHFSFLCYGFSHAFCSFLGGPSFTISLSAGQPFFASLFRSARFAALAAARSVFFAVGWTVLLTTLASFSVALAARLEASQRHVVHVQLVCEPTFLRESFPVQLALPLLPRRDQFFFAVGWTVLLTTLASFSIALAARLEAFSRLVVHVQLVCGPIFLLWLFSR